MLDPTTHQIPDCTVAFDDEASCGLNVARRDRFIEMTFVTRDGYDATHDLTVPQVRELRAALDALLRTDTAPGAPEVLHRVADPLPAHFQTAY